MLGFMDMGGGMRDVYGAGVTDCFLDNGISFDYCIGVSAGCANIATFLAGQRGRNFRFYTDYALRKEYMSAENFIKSGSFFNLDYVYSYLSNSSGENPLDFDAMKNNKSEFIVVATDAESGNPVYFNKKYLTRDNYDVIKASCAVPLMNKPYAVNGHEYFDGGVSDPLPVDKAFADGCDKIVAVLTRPVDFVKKPEKFDLVIHRSLGEKYPEVYGKIHTRHEAYNRSLEKLRAYQKEGRAVIIAPPSGSSISIASKDAKKLKKVYEQGYADAEKALENI